MLLSGEEIKKNLGTNIIIEPYSPSQLNPNSYNLRLSNELLVYDTDVLDMKDLTPGMQLTGTVRNVIDFGAFVDIGVHQDGLVHISQISSRFIRHPSEVLTVGDVVTVWVLSVDLQKKRIALTMKQPKTEQAH